MTFYEGSARSEGRLHQHIDARGHFDSQLESEKCIAKGEGRVVGSKDVTTKAQHVCKGESIAFSSYVDSYRKLLRFAIIV